MQTDRAYSSLETDRGSPVLRVDQLSKAYSTPAGPVPAIADISFNLSDGEFLSIVGPSGGGKTTLLNCISGLLPVTSGRIHMADKVVDSPPDGVSVVFQDYSNSLFPWLSVLSNVTLPLKQAKLPKKQAREAAYELLEQVGLNSKVVSSQYPWQLSGGMQQRVAIARALISKPKVLIMDEPFASVDAQTRIELEDLLLKLWSHDRKSILFVTHDIDESVYLSDRILVLSKSPAVVLETLDVPLPRPRDQLVTKHEEVFSELRARVMELVIVRRAQERVAASQQAPATSDKVV